MLEILLTILKVIGIILLCLLLAIIVVAGLILFVPVRYSASGYYRSNYAVKGKLSWLLHFITIKLMLQQEQELDLVVRVLGIPIYDMQRIKRKDAKKAAKAKTAKEVLEEPDESYNELKQTKPPVPHRPGSEDQSHQEAEKIPESVTSMESIERDSIEFEQSYEEHKHLNLLDKFKLFLGKCKERITNIKYTLLKICAKIKEIKDNITYYSDLLQEENTKQAFAACRKELLRIWKDIKPKRFRVNALLGLEDPATTGQIIGYCAMLYPLHQGKVVITPDFDEKKFKADFMLKGKITVYVYLIVAYTVFFNKNIKHLKKCLLREDS